MKAFAVFLEGYGFSAVEEEEPYQPDWTSDYKGYDIGSYIPNKAALTVEILCGDVWYSRPMNDKKKWDYATDSVVAYASDIIDEWEEECME